MAWILVQLVNKIVSINFKYFSRLQHRVDKMETTMSLIAQKVNAVLVKLDQFEDNSRKLSAKVRQISSAEVGEADKKKQVQDLVQEELKEMDS